MYDRLIMLASRTCSGTIGWDVQLEISHPGIVRRTDDAAIGRKSAKDQGFCAEVAQQDFEWRLVKGRVHRLQHEVVFVSRSHLLDEGPARTVRGEAVGNQRFGIRTPLPEIVVNIDGGDADRPAALFELRQPCCYWQSILK